MDESYGDDVELGGIEVTREIEVISAYEEPAISQPHMRWREAASPNAPSYSSERPLQDDFTKTLRSPNSWLEEDSNPSTPRTVD
jgi:hypothetical protein